MIPYINYKINNNLEKINTNNTSNVKWKIRPKTKKKQDNKPPIVIQTKKQFNFKYKFEPKVDFTLDIYSKPEMNVDEQPSIINEEIEPMLNDEEYLDLEPILKEFEDNAIDEVVQQLSSYRENKTQLNYVYQYEFKQNIRSTGFGDFVRGIYFMLQFSDKYNISVHFHINNHIIKEYLSYFAFKPNIENIYNEVEFFTQDNCIYTNNNSVLNYKYTNVDLSFSEFLTSLNVIENNIYFYCVNHPNKILITKTHKDIVKDILKPIGYIDYITNKYLSSLQLIKHKFITIHIRNNDDFFKNEHDFTLDKKIEKIVNHIQMINLKYKTDILLLSSDNTIKTLIRDKIPEIKCMLYPLTHTCENNDKTGIENAVRDFYVMSYSQFIYCFSVYQHGSGFSQWCAMTYDIPYTCCEL